MAEFCIIRNAYKARIKRVFDYLDVQSLRNPNDKQKKMLGDICDGVYFFNEEKVFAAESKMEEGDYLYEILYNGEKEFIGLYPPNQTT